MDHGTASHGAQKNINIQNNKLQGTEKGWMNVVLIAGNMKTIKV